MSIDSSKTTVQPDEKLTGMGAILHERGVFFRVWAPHAEKVYVTGDFNNWSEDKNELIHEDNGYWAGNIPEAKAGHQYKYILHTPSGILYKNDPYARQLTHSAGNSIIIDPHYDWTDQEYTMPPWNEWVIYELHVGTFHAKEKGKPGTFESLQEKLPYLEKLGINVIELMPPFEFPGSYSWGYDPSHPFAIESDYGGVKAFKDFINAAHEQGIAIVLDVVYNHFGPKDLDLWQFDGWSKDDQGGIYFYQDWRGVTPWGHTRPDYGRTEVKQYLRDNALMWLEEFHIDGLRIDGTAFIRNAVGIEGNAEKDLADGWSLLQWINEEIKSRFPWKIVIAEDLKDSEQITRKTEHGGGGFDAQWNAGFNYNIREVLAATKDADRDMEKIAETILKQYNDDAFERVIFTESHDSVANGQTRVPEQIVPDEPQNWFAKKRSILGAVLTLTSPGIPMIFQGQEMLEGGWFSGKIPLNWKNEKEFDGIIHLYRDLIRLRTNADGLSQGLIDRHVKIIHINDKEKVIVYHRWSKGGPKDSVVVVLNFSNDTYRDYNIGIPEEGLWKVRFNSDWEGYDPAFDNHFAHDTEAFESRKDGQGYNANISLGPYNALILSRD